MVRIVRSGTLFRLFSFAPKKIRAFCRQNTCREVKSGALRRAILLVVGKRKVLLFNNFTERTLQFTNNVSKCRPFTPASFMSTVPIAVPVAFPATGARSLPICPIMAINV